MIPGLVAESASARLWRGLEHALDRPGGAGVNPLRHCGALAVLMLGLLLVSGVWLYAVFDTSASGAYASIARLGDRPHAPGGMMRSLHRYATDAFLLFTFLHLLREALLGRWRHFRRYTWLTGVVLLPFAATAAIGGFWLNWDALGQFSALATAEWLDALPLFAQPLSRNFLVDAAVSDRLFSLFVFVHIGASLLLLFGLWFHLQRLTRATLLPPRALACGMLAALVALAWVAPVLSQAQAALAHAPAAVVLDWVALFVHPLMYATSPAFAWALVLGGLALLAGLPWWPGAPAPTIARVAAAHCNGCRRCFADCPYAAITMAPHPDRRRGRELAVVDAALCAGCGICAGACPSASPFQRAAHVTSGIDVPGEEIDALRARLDDALAAHGGAAPLAVFACARAVDTRALSGRGALVLPLACAGQLPPSFVAYALRAGAAQVLVTSCRDAGCTFRLGARWTRERLAGTREPHLRAGVRRARVLLLQAERGEEYLLDEVHFARAEGRHG